jgi:GGDEF domain-containing protein
MTGAPFGARRPRAVADVPPAALADGQVPAKGWLLALVAGRPLAGAAALPTAAIARDAPLLCAAALRAVGSDADLERLEGGDLASLAARVGELAAADEPAAVAAAVAALRTVLWDALAAADPPQDAAHAIALAQRLGLVCDVVAAAALGGVSAPRDEPAAFRPRVVAAPDAGVPAPESRTVQEAIAGRDGLPFALLAVEIDEAGRLLGADADGAFASALMHVELAVRNELRPADALVREAAGRWWLLASELGEGGGRSLAERVADAVAGAATSGGVPLAVSIGVAAAPADGTGAEALMARAERGLFASRAAGVPLA